MLWLSFDVMKGSSEDQTDLKNKICVTKIILVFMFLKTICLYIFNVSTIH